MTTHIRKRHRLVTAAIAGITALLIVVSHALTPTLWKLTPDSTPTPPSTGGDRSCVPFWPAPDHCYLPTPPTALPPTASEPSPNTSPGTFTQEQPPAALDVGSTNSGIPTGAPSPPPLPAASPTTMTTPPLTITTLGANVVPPPPVVINMYDSSNPQGGNPVVLLSSTDGKGNQGFRGRIAGSTTVLCSDPFAPNSAAPQCVGTLPSSGWYAFEVSYKIGGVWTKWSPPSLSQFLGDPCATVTWVSTEVKELVVPWNESASVVVGYTTTSPDRNPTRLDVVDTIQPGVGTRLHSQFGDINTSWPALAFLSTFPDSATPGAPYPADVVPVVVRVNPTITGVDARARERFTFTASWAHHPLGHGCRVNATVSFDVVRTGVVSDGEESTVEVPVPPDTDVDLKPCDGTGRRSPQIPGYRLNESELPSGEAVWFVCQVTPSPAH